jgi:hypothetical protein
MGALHLQANVEVCGAASRVANEAMRLPPRFAAPHAQRSELEASVNNALLGCTLRSRRTCQKSSHNKRTNERQEGGQCKINK